MGDAPERAGGAVVSADRLEEQAGVRRAFGSADPTFMADDLAVTVLWGDWEWEAGVEDVVTHLRPAPGRLAIEFFDRCESTMVASLTPDEMLRLSDEMRSFVERGLT